MSILVSNMASLVTWIALVISTFVQISFELDNSNDDNESNTFQESSLLLSAIDSSSGSLMGPNTNHKPFDFDVTGFAKHGFGKHGPSTTEDNSNNNNNNNNNNPTNTNTNTQNQNKNNKKSNSTAVSTQLNNNNNPYAHASMINSYKHFHYWNGEYFGVSNFPQSVAKFALEIAANESIAFHRAMDIGCAVGRISYELSQYFDFVQGIDFSHQMINVAKSLQNSDNLVWYMPNEGDIYDKFETTMEDLNLTRDENDEIGKNINFAQNDALNLDSKYTNYNLIVASNLIDRLSNPSHFLEKIKDRLNPDNGILVICTPYTWLEQYTAKSEWMGGKYTKNENGDTIPVFGRHTMKNILLNWFDLIKEKNIEMVFRETQWEYVHSISHCTAWMLKDN